jgi:pyruvate carboxylase
VLEIQNAFSAKGYRNLTITFDKDQAIIGGTVPTQEELDDAVRIVKQFTEFVQVKAHAGPGGRAERVHRAGVDHHQ